MRSKLRLSIALLGLAGALPSQAAEIIIPDYSLIPNGLNETTTFQNTNVNTPNGGSVLPATGTPVVYVISTLTFGTGSDAHLQWQFSVNETSALRLGVEIQDTGLVQFLGTGDTTRTNFNFNQDMAGQTVTLIAKLSFDLNNNVTAGKADAGSDTIMNVWVNPTGSDIEGSPNSLAAGDMSTIWASSGFSWFRQTIQNQLTPGTAGTSSITNTKVLTGANATFANALLAAGITPPSTVVNAGTSTVSASPLAVPANGTSTSTVTVTLKNADSIPIAGKLVSLSGSTGNATIQPAGAGTDTTNGGGQATFTVKSSTAETVVFSATGDSVPITQTASVDFTSPLTDAGNSTVTAAPATVPADGNTESTVTVTLKNSSGLPLSGKVVSLAKTSGPGSPTIAPATVATSASGVATFTVKSATAGTMDFTATCDTDTVTLSGDVVSVNFVTPDAPALLAYEGFDYPLGVLTGNNGGAGFSAGWTAPEASFICQVYDQSGGTLATWDNVVSGVAMSSPPRYIASVNTANPGSTAARVLASNAGTLAGADNVLWMSVVFHYQDTNSSAGLNIGLSSGGSVIDRGRKLSNAGMDFIGVTNWNQASESWNNRINTTIVDDNVLGTGYSGPHAQTLGTQALATTEDLLVVMKFTFGASDRVEAAFFTESQVAGAGFSEANFYSSPSYVSTIYAAGIDESAINTISYTQQRGFNALDEIRLGNTFKDLIGLASITSFEAAGATVVINQSAKTIAVEVPFGTNLATLAPTFTLSSGTCNQTSGAPPSPTFAVQNPATYTVTDTSTDPDTINSYTVAVTVLPQPPVIATLVIDLGTSPGGTAITGGTFIGSGPTNLPIPTLPPGSILRSIAVNAKLEATSGDNFAFDLAILVDTSAPYSGDNFSLGITSSSATASFSPAETLTWAGGSAGPGTSLTETRTDNEWTGDIDLATTGLFLANAFGSAPAGGTWSGTITLTYDDVSGGTTFATWSGGTAADGDANDDGVKNAVAYALGASNVNENAISRLPSFNNSSPSNVVFTFNRSDAAEADPSATITVEYGSTLSGWTTAVNGVGGVSIDDSAVPSAGLHTVVVTIPKSGGKLFARLKVVVSP